MADKADAPLGGSSLARIPDEGKTPQNWADFFGTVIWSLLEDAEDEGWAAGVPPETATLLREALDRYTAASDPVSPGSKGKGE